MAGGMVIPQGDHVAVLHFARVGGMVIPQGDPVAVLRFARVGGMVIPQGDHVATFDLPPCATLARPPWHGYGSCRGRLR